jgi:hypothetical protein
LRGRKTIERKMLEIDCCEREKMKIERERRTIERREGRLRRTIEKEEMCSAYFVF